VDETGQETAGTFLLVAVVVAGDARDVLLDWLSAVEHATGKEKTSWHTSRHPARQAYIDRVLNDARFSGSVFYAVYAGTRSFMPTSWIPAARHRQGDERRHDGDTQGQGVELAARAERPVLHVHAHLLAETGGVERYLEAVAGSTGAMRSSEELSRVPERGSGIRGQDIDSRCSLARRRKAVTYVGQL
jgi:hypothetical protein